MAGNPGRCVFNILQNCQVVLQNGNTISPVLPAMYESSSSTTYSPILSMVNLSNFGHSNSGISMWYLIYTSLMTNDNKQLFMSLSTIHLSSLVKCPNLLPIIWLCGFIFLLVSIEGCLHIMNISTLWDTFFANIFSHSGTVILVSFKW